MRLEGKTALITGGNSGIGRATAMLFAKEGAGVAVTGRNRERGDAVVAELRATGRPAVFVEADVRSSEECRRTVETTLEELGQLDVLFNNAGVYVAADAVACTEEEWDEQIDSSLKGAFLMSHFALPHMIERGSGAIVNMSSGWGLQGGEEAVAYCAAKAGVIGMTKAMALDHGPQGIRVNAVCPGDTVTPMEEADAAHRGWDWDEYVRWASERPLRRMGDPEEIASVVLFLASEESSFVTGAALPVDGGGSA
ncbi:MAG: SDR family NAD(P)-dependent oxidoreductase [Actinomycetota bacterium]